MGHRGSIGREGVTTGGTVLGGEGLTEGQYWEGGVNRGAVLGETTADWSK